MKKVAITFLSVLIAVTVRALPVTAMGNLHTKVIAASTSVQPKAEQTKWITRTYNGKTQKRLWSITNSCWLTDWIDC